jgi:hypothetical protein
MDSTGQLTRLQNRLGNRSAPLPTRADCLVPPARSQPEASRSLARILQRLLRSEGSSRCIVAGEPSMSSAALLPQMCLPEKAHGAYGQAVPQAVPQEGKGARAMATRVPQCLLRSLPKGLSCVGLLVWRWSFSLGAAGPPSASERFKSGSLRLSRRPLPRPMLGRARTDSGWSLTLS